MVKGLTKVHNRIPSRLLARAQFRSQSHTQSAVPVLPPRLAVLEIAVLLVIPALLEWLWPPFPNLTTFQPHPYWVAILILSLQYGTVSGLLTAAVAIVATVVIGLPEPDIGENHFAYLVRVWTQPVLWISAALLLGHFRVRQIEQRSELTRIVQELQQRTGALTSHANGLKARCDALERRLVVRPQSDATALLNSLSSLTSAVAQGRLPASFDTAMNAAFPGAVATLYASINGALLPVARSRQGAAGSAPRLLGDDGLVLAVTEGRAMSVTSGLDDALLSGLGVFAVPVGASDAGIAGLVLVESLPAGLIDQGTSGRLQTLAGVFGKALAARQSTHLDQTITTTVAATEAATSADPPVRIPVVPRWRQSRWIPSVLRSSDPRSNDLVHEEPAEALPQHRSPSTVSR